MCTCEYKPKGDIAFPRDGVVGGCELSARNRSHTLWNSTKTYWVISIAWAVSIFKVFLTSITTSCITDHFINYRKLFPFIFIQINNKYPSLQYEFEKDTTYDLTCLIVLLLDIRFFFSFSPHNVRDWIHSLYIQDPRKAQWPHILVPIFLQKSNFPKFKI